MTKKLILTSLGIGILIVLVWNNWPEWPKCEGKKQELETQLRQIPSPAGFKINVESTRHLLGLGRQLVTSIDDNAPLVLQFILECRSHTEEVEEAFYLLAAFKRRR